MSWRFAKWAASSRLASRTNLAAGVLDPSSVPSVPVNSKEFSSDGLTRHLSKTVAPPSNWKYALSWHCPALKFERAVQLGPTAALVVVVADEVVVLADFVVLLELVTVTVTVVVADVVLELELELLTLFVLELEPVGLAVADELLVGYCHTDQVAVSQGQTVFVFVRVTVTTWSAPATACETNIADTAAMESALYIMNDCSWLFCLKTNGRPKTLWLTGEFDDCVRGIRKTSRSQNSPVLYWNESDLTQIC